MSSPLEEVQNVSRILQDLKCRAARQHGEANNLKGLEVLEEGVAEVAGDNLHSEGVELPANEGFWRLTVSRLPDLTVPGFL